MTILERSMISNEEFINKIIIPSHFQAALHDSCSFGIRDRTEQILICSNDYARDIGYHNFKDAMLKRPDHDFERRFGSMEYFNIQMNFLINNKKSFHYTYRNKKNNTIHMMVSEPLFNFQGEVIGTKEINIPLKLLSHRALVERHFKKKDINVAVLDNIIRDITLTEKEEMILFLLIAGYSQMEIGKFLHSSRSYILKIINESLCAKFALEVASTKLLVEKAISLGFANFIPHKFLNSINSEG